MPYQKSPYFKAPQKKEIYMKTKMKLGQSFHLNLFVKTIWIVSIHPIYRFIVIDCSRKISISR